MNIRWTRSAQRDISAIVRYIRKDSEAAAQRVKSRLALEVAKLGATPELGHAGTVEGTREILLAWSYIAVYRIIRNEIQIVRIRHGAQQWPPEE